MNRFLNLRLIALFLTCIMLTSAFTGCVITDYLYEFLGSNSNAETESTTSPSAQDDTDAPDNDSTDDLEQHPTEDSPKDPTDDPADEPSATAISSVAQIELGTENGMAYIIQLSDGRFIVIDGGASDGNVRFNMLSYMQEKTNAEKPVIACWMFTHLDGDHFDNAYEFLRSYRKRVELQGFAYSFPLRSDFEDRPDDAQNIKDYKAGARSVYDTRMAKWNKLCELYPNVDYWDMKADEKRTYADVNIHILITANERLPENVYTHNQRSAAFKMTFTQGTEATGDDHSFMVFGDCSGTARLDWMRETYGNEILKSDVMQVIHHGLLGGDKNMYKAVDPDICFWPTNWARFSGNYDSDGDGTPDGPQYCTQEVYNMYLRSDRIKERQHYHHSQTTVINMTNLDASVWEGPLDV